MRRTYLLLSLLFAFAAPPASAAQYSYHPDSRLYLSGGFNPYYPGRGYLICIDHEGEQAMETEGAVGTDVGISLVTSREDLYQKINYSASLGGSYMVYNASGSVRYEDEQAFHSDSLTWIIFFKSDYGHFALKNPRLKGAYARSSPDSLYETCGSEIVTERKKGVMLFALLTVRNLSQSRRTEFEAKLSGSASGPVWSARMDAQYKKIFRSALATSDISVRIRAMGGRGVTDITELLKSEGGDSAFVAYEKLPDIMSKYIGNMDARNAAPTQYVTTQLKSFQERVPVRFNDFQAGQVGVLYNRHTAASTIVSRIDGILSASADSFDLNPEERRKLADVRDAYTVNMNTLFSAAQKCFEVRSSCAVPRTTNAEFTWPRARATDNHCEDLRAYVRSRGLINDDIYRMAQRRNFAPILDGDKGTIGGWSPCAELGRD